VIYNSVTSVLLQLYCMLIFNSWEWVDEKMCYLLQCHMPDICKFKMWGIFALAPSLSEIRRRRVPCPLLWIRLCCSVRPVYRCV